MTKLDIWIAVFEELDYVVVDLVTEGPVHTALLRRKDNLVVTTPKSNVILGDVKIYVDSDTDEVKSLTISRDFNHNLSNVDWFYKNHFELFREVKLKLLGI